MIPWDHSLDNYRDQPKFKNPEGCQYEESLKDMNKWNFVSPILIQKDSDMVKAQVNAVYQSVVDFHTEINKNKIRAGRYGAIDAPTDPDGFWMVKWYDLPYQLEKDQTVEGTEEVKIPKGSWVCRGQYMHRISHAPGWYEQRFTRGTDDAKVYTFWLQHCLNGGVPVQKYTKDKQPPRAARGAYIVGSAQGFVKFVSEEMREQFKITKKRRSHWTPYKFNAEIAADQEAAKRKKAKRKQQKERRDQQEAVLEEMGAEDLGVEDLQEASSSESESEED
jgi:hypothetical protein